MATLFLSNAKLFLPHLAPTLFSPSKSAVCSQNPPHGTQIVACKSRHEASGDLSAGRRSIFVNLTAFILGTGLLVDTANATILEADDDVELLEKVKADRKKRLERQGAISTLGKEKGYLQDLVYKLSKVGQAIEKNDLLLATSVLGSSKDNEWVQKVNLALSKFTSSEEEKTEVNAFNSSLASLISSVSVNDVEASKMAFVASASAFEKWTTLSGLVDQLKGL